MISSDKRRDSKRLLQFVRIIVAIALAGGFSLALYKHGAIAFALGLVAVVLVYLRIPGVDRRTSVEQRAADMAARGVPGDRAEVRSVWIAAVSEATRGSGVSGALFAFALWNPPSHSFALVASIAAIALAFPAVVICCGVWSGLAK